MGRQKIPLIKPGVFSPLITNPFTLRMGRGQAPARSRYRQDFFRVRFTVITSLIRSRACSKRESEELWLAWHRQVFATDMCLNSLRLAKTDTHQAAYCSKNRRGR